MARSYQYRRLLRARQAAAGEQRTRPHQQIVLRRRGTAAWTSVTVNGPPADECGRGDGHDGGERRAADSRTARTGRELRLERLRGLEPFGRVRVYRAVDRAGELRRDVQSHLPDWRAVPIFVALPQLADRPATDRERTGDEPVKQDADAVDVALSGGRLAKQHLGREVQRSAREV